MSSSSDSRESNLDHFLHLEERRGCTLQWPSVTIEAPELWAMVRGRVWEAAEWRV